LLLRNTGNQLPVQPALIVTFRSIGCHTPNTQNLLFISPHGVGIGIINKKL
jgi:hypothetical protein